MISKNFARCLAKISGDGNLYWGKSTRYVRYSNTCDELRDEFQKDINEEFGSTPLTKGSNNSGVKFLQTNRRIIMERFLFYLRNYTSSAIYVPESIKQADKSVQKEYLRAFYDDEGCAALRLYAKGKEWKRNVTLASNSLRLLEEIKTMLLDFDIESNKIIRNKPNSNKDKCYTLAITGKDNIIKFKENIGFKHPNKARKLDLMILSYKANSRNTEAFGNMKRELMIPLK
ncbi:hypothetical protein HYV80_02365 [Candidatus Woesearchaeota archaeon]|nr:hypothetical protein [Candidatus Woesearchaeota archaeon]